MKSTKYLLIGGGLASSQAAKQIRKADPQSPITLVGDEPYVPYDRPPLSKEFLRGEKPREALFFDPEQYLRDHGIDLILGVAVKQLDLPNKTAILAKGESPEDDGKDQRDLAGLIADIPVDYGDLDVSQPIALSPGVADARGFPGGHTRRNDIDPGR